jgi:sulfate adenylyltransferase subunit 1 (EFTu-like GTPase family)
LLLIRWIWLIIQKKCIIKSKPTLKNAKSTFKEQNVSYIPLSALTGDNVLIKRMLCLVQGQTILEHLEALEPADVYERGQARFPVQTVIRPKQKNTMILEDMPVNCTEILK